ncbi:uncharacterized protein [Dysidea avara]|uniref:uncharacterized protein isoform X2 n=1 Tax=Dysidea avara TaxID=196820 RepID=UPI00331C7E28
MSEDSAISSAPDDIHPQLENEEDIVNYTTEPSNISTDKGTEPSNISIDRVTEPSSISVDTVQVSKMELVSVERDLTLSRNMESRNSSHSASRILKASSKSNMDMDDGNIEVATTCFRLCVRQNICLVVMISVVIGLFLIPIILYYTGRGGLDNVFDDLSVLNCRDLANASGDCEEHISSVCDGLMGNSKLSVFDDSITAEDTLATIVSITSDNQSCAEGAKAFFCNATYRSCDNGVTFVPSVEECHHLQSNVCSNEWSQLRSVSPNLTNCNMYDFTCPDQFGKFCGDKCLPLCTEFSQNSEGVTVLLTVVIGIISNIGNILGGIAVFAVAFSKGKTVTRFPQVLILYSTTTVFITVIIITVPSFSRSVFCSHDDLFSTVAEPSAFCEVYGFTYQGGILIFSGFWLLFIIHLFLKLVFPIRARNLDHHPHRGKIHAAEIILIVLVGLLVPSIIVGTSKYNIANFPPTQCAGDADVSFYTLILPTIIVMATGVILILLTFTSIQRRKGIFKREGKNKLSFLKFSTPEVKLLIVFFYFTIVQFIFWTDFSVQIRNRNRLFTAINEYSSCVRDGDKPECDQDLDDFREVKRTIRTLTRRFTSSKEFEPPKTTQL